MERLSTTRLNYKLNGKIHRAIIIQSLLFGLWHGPSIHALLTAVFGYIYGVIYAKTGRLAPIMISHWLGDVLAFGLMYYIM